MLRKSADRDYTTTAEFLEAKAWIVLLALAAFVLALPLAFRLKQYVEKGARPGIPPGALEVFRRPFSVALMFALITIIGQTSTAPISIAAGLYLIVDGCNAQTSSSLNQTQSSSFAVRIDCLQFTRRRACLDPVLARS